MMTVISSTKKEKEIFDIRELRNINMEQPKKNISSGNASTVEERKLM